MMYAGIDGGSRAIKIALYDSKRQTLAACACCDQGIKQNDLAADLFASLLREQNISRKDVRRIVATGYARNLIALADTTITEITCHAVGVRHLAPDAQTVIEIGGQDSKILRLDSNGAVRDFAMNDRCAAGTGRFLEIATSRLGASLDDVGALVQHAQTPAAISSTCVVFAETEIIGLLASGAKPEDILAGVQKSIATRISSMLGRNVAEPIYFTGGVAQVAGMKEALESALQKCVHLTPQSQFTGALGAAILAARGDKKP